jgi:hypothetical protein
MGVAAQPVHREVILDERLVDRGQHQVLLRQDVEQGLVGETPNLPLPMVNEGQDLAHGQELHLPIRVQGKAQGGGQLGEQTPECPPAGVVTLVEEPLLRLRELVRPPSPRLLEMMPISGQGRMLHQRIGGLIG